jgi:hypothetical protein
MRHDFICDEEVDWNQCQVLRREWLAHRDASAEKVRKHISVHRVTATDMHAAAQSANSFVCSFVNDGNTFNRRSAEAIETIQTFKF